MWNEHMQKIMNEENEWDLMVETDAVEGPVEKVARKEIVEAMQKMKSGKAIGPSKVSVKMIVGVGHEKKGFIGSNGSGSYEFV